MSLFKWLVRGHINIITFLFLSSKVLAHILMTLEFRTKIFNLRELQCHHGESQSKGEPVIFCQLLPNAEMESDDYF